MCNMCMWVEGATLPEPDLPGPLWTGLQCMSLLFPKDFNWRDTIYQGKTTYKGPLGKKALGRRTALSFTDCIMIMGQTAHVNSLMSYSVSITYGFLGQGFSIGIGDMRITKETAKRVRQECADIDIKAEELRKLHGDEAEPKINRMLNQTRDSMGKIAQDAMPPDNCLGLMVRSGSKGSMVNILQIMACVGQQNVSENACKPLSQIEHFQCSSHLTTRCVPEDLSSIRILTVSRQMSTGTIQSVVVKA